MLSFGSPIDAFQPPSHPYNLSQRRRHPESTCPRLAPPPPPHHQKTISTCTLDLTPRNDIPAVPDAVTTALRNLYTTSYAAISLGRCAHELGRRATDLLTDSRSTVAHALHTDADCELLFFPSEPTATYTLAQSLCRSLKPRDEILLACNLPDDAACHWYDAASLHGVVPRIVKSDLLQGSLPGVPAFAQFVNARTRAFILPVVCPITQTLMPLSELSAFCKGVGVPFILHDAGNLPATRRRLCAIPLHSVVKKADVVFLDTQAVFGTSEGAACVVRKDLLTRLPPVSGGEFALVDTVLREAGSIDITDEARNWTEVPERFEGGAAILPIAVTLAAAAADIQAQAEAQTSTSSKEDEDKPQQLAEYLHARLEHCAHVRLITRMPAATTNFEYAYVDDACSAMFHVDGCDVDTLSTKLAERGVLVSAGAHGVGVAHNIGLGLDSSIRVTFHTEEHTEGDVDSFVAILSDVVTNLVTTGAATRG